MNRAWAFSLILGTILVGCDAKDAPTVPAPQTAITRFAFGEDSIPKVLLQVGDTGQVVVSFSNPLNKIGKLEWKDATGNRLRISQPGVREGRDTLMTEGPALGDSMFVHVEATDALGNVWKDSILVLGVAWKRLADRPIPAYAKAGPFQVDQPFVAAGGEIFALGSQGAGSSTAGTVFDPIKGEWKAIAEAPILGSTVALGNDIFAAGGKALYKYSLAQDRWDSVAALPAQTKELLPRKILTVDGKLAIGIVRNTGPPQGPNVYADPDGPTVLFDPASGIVSAFPGGITGPIEFAFAARERVYCYSYSTYYGYESPLMSCNVKTNDVTQWPVVTYIHHARVKNVEINGYSYFVDLDSVTVFDEERATITKRAGPGFPSSLYDTLAGDSPDPDAGKVQSYVLSGRIWAFDLVRPDWVQVKTFAPGDSGWKEAEPFAVHGDRFASVMLGDTVYILAWYSKGDARADGNPSFYSYHAIP